MPRGGCSCRRIIPPLRLALQAADQGVFRLYDSILALQNSILALQSDVLRLNHRIFALQDSVFSLERGVFDPDLRPQLRELGLRLRCQ